MNLNVEDKTKFEKTVIFGTFEKGFENQNGETFKESKAQKIKLDHELTTIKLFHMQKMVGRKTQYWRNNKILKSRENDLLVNRG